MIREISRHIEETNWPPEQSKMREDNNVSKNDFLLGEQGLLA